MCEKPTSLEGGWIALLIFNNFMYVDMKEKMSKKYIGI